MISCYDSRIRVHRDETEEWGYRFGNFQLLPQRRRLLCGSEIVPLSPKVFDILVVLVEHHGRIVSKDEIYAEVWPETFVEEQNLTVHISSLRKALGTGAIATIPGRGYQFVIPIEQPERDLRESVSAAPEPILAKPKSNLSQPLSEIIGREGELADLPDCIRRSRLITLTGPGGIGKTRLAIELGWRILSSFPDGVWLIDLAPLTDPAVVATAAAAVLGVELRGIAAPAETVAKAIGKQRMLLIFDNCEYLIDAAVGLIETLLQRAPGLSVLATSQEILRIPTEQVYRLNPLAVPPGDETGRKYSTGQIAKFGAVELFVICARAADRRFMLDVDNAAAVAEICRNLDGIPLALQMAAARLPLLGFEALRAGLDERLYLLTVGPRTAEERHRTLRAMVDWSYALLNETDRRVFRRLGVFAGGFFLDAAVAVAGEESECSWETVDALGRLIDKSLVSVEGGKPPRYRLLETLRLYAVEKLKADSQSEMIVRRHAYYFATLFDYAYEVWEVTPEAEWMATYRLETDNVRAALSWAFNDTDRSHIAVSLSGSAAFLWERLALTTEGRIIVDRAIPFIDDRMSNADTARLLRLAGTLWHNDDRIRACALLEQSAVLYRGLGRQLELARVLSIIGLINIHQAQYARAKAVLLDAEKMLSQTECKKSLYNVTVNLGCLAVAAHEADDARKYLYHAVDLARRIKDTSRKAVALSNLAELEFRIGNVDRAIELVQENLLDLRSFGRASNLAMALNNLSEYYLEIDNISESRIFAEESLLLAQEFGGYILRLCLMVWALLGALGGRCQEAAQLIGFICESGARAGDIIQPGEEKLYDRLQNLLRATLSASEICALKTLGSQLSEREAINLVQTTMI